MRDDAGLLTSSACGFRWLSSSGSGRMQCRARTSTKHMKMYFNSEPFGAMRPILFFSFSSRSFLGADIHGGAVSAFLLDARWGYKSGGV